jgi:hypothetical protein
LALGAVALSSFDVDVPERWRDSAAKANGVSLQNRAPSVGGWPDSAGHLRGNPDTWWTAVKRSNLEDVVVSRPVFG